jgi:phytoene dehydrogenase-like protein
VTLAGAPYDSLHARIFNFDPTLAPEGSTVVQVYLSPRYEDWKALSRDRERYVAEKKAVAEAVDVATPVTFERYTSNWRGSFEGWLLTPKTMMLRMKRTLEGLDRLYLAGQWLQPGGGLPTAIGHGRTVVQRLCARDGKDFVTTG